MNRPTLLKSERMSVFILVGYIICMVIVDIAHRLLCATKANVTLKQYLGNLINSYFHFILSLVRV